MGCTPASPTTLSAWRVGVDAAGARQPCTVGGGHGRWRTIDTDRDATDVPWREGEDAWWGNGGDRTSTKATAGTLLYRQALATPHQRDRPTVEAVVQAGRARGNLEPEHNQPLNTTGDPLEHHDGHGPQHLAAV